MTDKHFKVALILLTLPLSFGGDTTGGATAKTAGAVDANYLQSLKESAKGHRGFQSADVAGRFGAVTDGLAGTPGTFVSSFDAVETKRDAKCLSSNINCIAGGEYSTAGNSAMGFPMYDAFNNSETSQYSHGTGSAGPLGPGSGFSGGGGGSGGGSGNGPTSTPIATPEPGSFVLLAGGLLMLAGLARQRRQRYAA